jgi:hypothetical protein
VRTYDWVTGVFRAAGMLDAFQLSEEVKFLLHD